MTFQRCVTDMNNCSKGEGELVIFPYVTDSCESYCIVISG